MNEYGYYRSGRSNIGTVYWDELKDDPYLDEVDQHLEDESYINACVIRGVEDL